ncbi:MAG: Stp1/IreP family PP2C-type Ser/Thr phosphatase, partial [Anaerolineae bacterium]
MTKSFPDAAGLTDAGVQRHNNEDTWSGPPPDLPPDIAAVKGFLYVVADGVGGHQGGEVASRIAAQTTQKAYYGDGNVDVGDSLRAAIEEANRRIYHQGISSPNEYGMSTTITAAVVQDNEIIVANVGDSRAYLIHDGRAHQLTTDHTLVEEQRQAGILTAQEAANHPRRNVITRSLGGELHVSVDVFPPHRLAGGDQLLLCSDGLSDLVSERELAHIVTQSRNSGIAVSRLIELARKRGAPDNVTAVVVKEGRKTRQAVDGISSRLGNLAALAAAAAAVLLLGGTIAVLRGLLPVPWTGISAASTPGLAAAETEAPPAAAPATAVTPREPAILFDPDDGSSFTEAEQVKLTWGWPLTLTRKQRFVAEIRVGEETVISKTVGAREDATYDAQLGSGRYQWQVHVEEMIDGSWELLPGTQSEMRTFEVVPPRPVPTPAPTATPTPQPQAPVLIAPGGSTTQQSPVTFAWQGTLAPGQLFQVKVWHPETGTRTTSVPLTDLSWTTDLPAERSGEWLWQVSVLQNGNEVVSSDEWRFDFKP